MLDQSPVFLSYEPHFIGLCLKPSLTTSNSVLVLVFIVGSSIACGTRVDGP